MKAGCLKEFKKGIRDGASIDEIKAVLANHLMIRYGTVYPKEDVIIGLGRARLRKGVTIEILERLFHQNLRKNGFNFERLRGTKWPANWSHNNESKLVIKTGTEEEVFPDIYWYII
jgi:hypothetical protein